MTVVDCETAKPREVSLPRLSLLYSGTLIGGILLFALACAAGRWLESADTVRAVTEGASAPAKERVLFHVLLALFVVILLGRILGKGLRYLAQPPVIGEVMAGIALGPSLLGWLAPDVAAYLLPPSVAPSLGVIAQIAVILYMFLVGLEFDGAMLEQKGTVATVISHFGILVPFVLGGVLALGLYPYLAPPGVRFLPFALFVGISLSITAFPILARMLIDRGLNKTPLGVMAITCAAADDVTAWCLLAVVVAFAQAGDVSLWGLVLGPLAYILGMFFLVRPLLKRMVRWQGAQELNQGLLAIVFVLLLASTLLTEWLGIGAIFGAFLLGAVVPHDSVVGRQLPDKLQNAIAVLLLPAFFAYTGMRTQIGLLAGPTAWLVCLAVILVAILGKLGGVYLASRIVGMPRSQGFALGTLMNTRALMELIVLNIGLDLGVISPEMFAMFVIMALVTTLMTSPLLQVAMRLGCDFGPPAE